MAEINVEMLKEKLYPVAKALFIISEIIVDVSNQHISKEDALVKICSYMHDADVICSRSRVDKLIEDCTTDEVSREEIARQIFDDYFLILDKKDMEYYDHPAMPDCCDGCSNNPKNGGSGICHCTIPYMQNPTNYTVLADDLCMANNIGGYVFVTNTQLPEASTSTTDRIAEAVERTKKYVRKQNE